MWLPLHSLAMPSALDADILDQDCCFPCRHERTLFAHISQITWESHPRGHCKGAVSDVKSGDIRSFDLDPAELSSFELTKSLWDLIA